MQAEAGLAAGTAVAEMLVQERDAVLHVFPAIPDAWREASFAELRVPGALRVSARRRKGKTEWVGLQADADTGFRLENPYGGAVRCLNPDVPSETETVLKGEILALSIPKGERRVLLPLLAPGILAGALLAFTLSIDDFVITFFVAGPGATTLPIRVYSMIKHGATPVINALSTLMLVVTFLAVIGDQRLMQERE